MGGSYAVSSPGSVWALGPRVAEGRLLSGLDPTHCVRSSHFPNASHSCVVHFCGCRLAPATHPIVCRYEGCASGWPGRRFLDIFMVERGPGSLAGAFRASVGRSRKAVVHVSPFNICTYVPISSIDALWTQWLSVVRFRSSVAAFPGPYTCISSYSKRDIGIDKVDGLG